MGLSENSRQVQICARSENRISSNRSSRVLDWFLSQNKADDGGAWLQRLGSFVTKKIIM